MNEPTLIFYDGACGLCHGFVLFVLKRDPAGRFRFAPLQGQEIRERLAPEVRRTLPDSVVVLEDGGVLVKSDAALRVLAELGGAWPFLARVSRAFPRALRDAVYDLVARLRRRLFRAPSGACPVVPADLRERFLD
ncbi:MAG TPA: DCC1-like thiol-disulfide oxidoreductase family protein [bacterium]|nr:DCC1-like thiol-disulfide oxidoreductase family protein [bacterium]